MKLFTKISLILAAIAGGVGILAIIIGLAMGAKVYDLSNMGIYLSPHQQVAVSGVITEVVEETLVTEVEEVVEAVENAIDHNYVPTEEIIVQHHNEKLHSHTCSFHGIQRLEVDVQNAQIIIFAVDSTEDFGYYSDKEKSIAKVEGTTLKLEDRSSIQDKIELELYVPMGVLKEIEIEAINGTIWADKMVADNVTIEIDNASVQIDELIVTNKAELQINAGQMVIGYYEGTNLETECAMGSIMVVCEGNKDDYNYDVECGMGSIRIGEDSYSGIGRELWIENESVKTIKAECALGEILLEFPNNM